MRVTVHIVSAADYRHDLPALLPMLRAVRRARPDEGAVGSLELDPLAESMLRFAAEPRTLGELREHLLDAAPQLPADAILWRLRRHAPLLHAPAEAPWAFGRRPSLIAARSWVPDLDPSAAAVGMVHLVRRYLRAFGPATVVDLAAWSGLTAARLRPAVEALEPLERFSDERGRALLDLPGAPLPDGDVPIPVRFLPMWDELLLAHADRTRIISDAHRARVVARNGDVAPTFLVDGRVAGIWWAGVDGGRTRITLEPFGELGAPVRDALEEEAERLAAFVGPIEPELFRRYRTSRARRDPAAGWRPISPQSMRAPSISELATR